MHDYDENVATEFAMHMKRVNDQECATEVKGLSITLNEDVISALIGIPKGKKWDKEG